MRLDEYVETFAAQNYTNLDQISQLSWEDLTDIGVKKLGRDRKSLKQLNRAELLRYFCVTGHLKKLVLALKRLKDLKNIKTASNVLVHQPGHSDSGRNSSQSRSAPPGEVLVINVPTTTNKTTAEVRPFCHQQNGSNVSNSNLVTFQHLSPRGLVNSATDELLSNQCCTDPLNNSPSHRHMSQARYQQLIAESHLVPGSYDTFPPRSHQIASSGHNNLTDQQDCNYDGRPTVSVKPRPVAKIVAKTKRNSGEVTGGEVIYSLNGNDLGDSTDRLKSLCYESNFAHMSVSRLNGTTTNERIYANCPAFPSDSHQQQLNSVVGCQNLSPRRLPLNQRQFQKDLQPPPVPPKRVEPGEMGSRRITNGLYGGLPVSGPPNSLAVFQLSSGASLNDSVELSPATSVEEFPPPPSPITCEQTVRALRSMREGPAQPETVEQPPIFGTSTYLVGHQQNRQCHSANGSPAIPKKPVAPVLPSQPGRNDSITSIDSTSSGDTIPFANENVGTIRQKSPRGSEMSRNGTISDLSQKLSGVDKRPAVMEIFAGGPIRPDRSKA